MLDLERNCRNYLNLNQIFWLTALIYKVGEIDLHLSLKLRLTGKYLKSLTFCQWPSQMLER